MRDGVTGNTSGFELEIEGSTPSPVANFRSQLKVLRLRLINGEVVFIRFVGGEIDEDSRVAAGLFCAASELCESGWLPEYEVDALAELRDWFNVHLKSPFDYLPEHPRYEHAICWFKSTAREHLVRAWELVTILERNDVFIWTVKVERPGRVHYEDEVQVFALPSPEVRLLLKR